jgi:hypothetical protein
VPELYDVGTAGRLPPVLPFPKYVRVYDPLGPGVGVGVGITELIILLVIAGHGINPFGLWV